MNRFEAHDILAMCDIPEGANFFLLSTSQVEALLNHADRLRYRKPKSANGSRGRYFYARVCRALEKKG